MSKLPSLLTIALCALSTHCADERDRGFEGRIYVTADVTVKRVDASFSKRAEDGNLVYWAELDLAPGALAADAQALEASVQLPPDRTLATGDNPGFCSDYPDDNGGLEKHECIHWDDDEGRPAQNPWARPDVDPFPGGLFSPGASRIVFEVVRPANEVAPTLDGEVWRVYVADPACEMALAAQQRDPWCPAGVTCIGTVRGEKIEYQVDATSCRWRAL